MSSFALARDARNHAAFALLLLGMATVFAWLGARVTLVPGAPLVLTVGLPLLACLCVVLGGANTVFARWAWQRAHEAAEGEADTLRYLRERR